MVGMVLMVAGVAACGDSDSNGDAAGDATTTTAGSTDDTGTDTGDDDFQALIDKAKDSKYKVTYRLSTTEGGEETLITVASDGEGKLAYFTDDGDTHVISDGDNSTFCSDVNTEPECIESTGGLGSIAAGAVAAYASLLGQPAQALQGASGEFADESTETIAGREAQCVTLDFLSLEYKACVDKETGITLLWSASAGGQGGSYEATEFADPTDSDFEPDAEPTEVTTPSLPGGITIPSIPGG
jgi:hypothetical protein